MKFRTGQKVVCINDHWETDCVYRVKRGVIYTIQSFYRCKCGSIQVTLFEMPFITNMICGCGHHSTRRRTYYTWRFAPLENSQNSYSSSKEKKEPAQKLPDPEPVYHEECETIPSA